MATPKNPWPISLFFFFFLSAFAAAVSDPPPSTSQFPFPETASTVVSDPTNFFSPTLLSSPLPTNSFFQNFVLNNGDLPEYIHPYLMRIANSSLSVSYPSRSSNSSITQLQFFPDLTINSFNRTHFVSSFNDLGVNLDLGDYRFYLVRGSPYLTFSVLKTSSVSISTGHGVRSVDSCDSSTKHIIRLRNGRNWVLYSTAAIGLIKASEYRIVTSGGFSGVIRVAVVPDSEGESEKILDRYRGCYPVSGFAKLLGKFGVNYKWQKRGSGDLLMVAHPLHRRLLPENQTVLKNLRYGSIDGDLLGVVGGSWDLNFDPVPVTWHSINGGIDKKFFPEIAAALRLDVKSLNTTELSSTASSYFYGKLIARAARLALIAEEVDFAAGVVPAVAKFLRNGIQPWLDGKFGKNGFLYERKWAGLVTENGASSTTEDFGFGVYNDHHFHLGYFVYSIAVLAKIDPNWAKIYKPHAYALVSDYMNFRPKKFPFSIPFRNFDFWKLHSWAAGLHPFPDGPNQESTSEAVNAYYAAALLGLAYGDEALAAAGTALATAEILAAETWWHVRSDSGIYEKGFVEENRVVGILWGGARESRLWFAPAEWRECRLGIQVLPVVPVTERLFSDEGYVRELVEWAAAAVERADAGEGWKGFAYALEGIYDGKNGVEKIKKLKNHDDGNSLSNLLWWIYSRPGGRS